jgi:hypothetical protein
VSWCERVTNHLSQLKGHNGTALSYVIRKKESWPKGTPFKSKEEKRLYSVKLEGPLFEEDNNRVWAILAGLLSGSPGMTWISEFEHDGRKAMKALRDHYDGPGERKKRVGQAYSTLRYTEYKSEKQFSFENYVTRLSQAFEDLAEAGLGKNETEKVNILMEGIVTENGFIQNAKASVMVNPLLCDTFVHASNCLSELVASTLVNSARSSLNGRPAARSIAAVESDEAGGRGRGNGSGRGRGRGGRGGRGGQGVSNTIYSQNGRQMNNGIDITDLSRTYTHAEWQKLHYSVREQIRTARINQQSDPPQAGSKDDRNVAAATSRQSVLQEDTPDPQHASGHGNYFGSGAYTPPSNKRPKWSEGGK